LVRQQDGTCCWKVPRMMGRRLHGGHVRCMWHWEPPERPGALACALLEELENADFLACTPLLQPLPGQPRCCWLVLAVNHNNAGARLWRFLREFKGVGSKSAEKNLIIAFGGLGANAGGMGMMEKGPCIPPCWWA
jgi:hypothetical protein